MRKKFTSEGGKASKLQKFLYGEINQYEKLKYLKSQKGKSWSVKGFSSDD